MRKNKTVKTIFIFITLFLFNSNANSAGNEKTQKEIHYLLTYIEQSECLFNRNGIDYEGSEVISHINKKYTYFKDEIKTTEDFIALSATKSELSGKKYTVRCNDGETEELGQWLHEVLNKLSRGLTP